MKSLLSLITLLFFTVSGSFCQDTLRSFSFNKTIKLDGKSNVEKIEIQIKAESEELIYGLNGKISSGAVRLALYDPQGRRRNGMGLKSRNGRQSKGVLEEAIGYPQPGTWVLKIKKKGVQGTVKVSVKQN